MADISKITLPSNVTYDVKDTTARSGLANKQDKITAITAQTTQAVYPIKIDSQGHITAYGSAVTIPAAVSTTQKVYTGSCDTLSTTLEKVVTLHDATGFSLTSGVVIIIYFENMSGTFSGTSAISLNVNNTGSKTVYRGPVEVKNSYGDLGGWNDKSIVGFAYDGSHWNRFYSMDANTTYLAMTEAEAKAGTVVNAKVISPSVLATAIDYRLPTKTSQLTNDSGFLTSHQDISGKVDKINITAQNTQAVYPIKINAQGQISAYGSAVTIPAAVAVKGNSESTYRTGNVNLTAANIGAAASSHAHGDITSGGDITATATIASGDRLIINDESASKITNSSITFGTSTTTFLRNNGTWGTVDSGTSVYNGTSSSATKYDRLNMTEIASGTGDSVNMMTTIDILWTNASPGSSFSEQDVSVNASNYRFLLIIFRLATDGRITSQMCKVDESIGWSISQINTGSNLLVRRNYQVFSDYVHFNNAANSGTYGNSASATSYLVPLYIYGIK